MIVRILAISAVALAIGAYAEQAHAGQIFICEDGRTVEVELQNLEAVKRSDSCVAKYFGIKISGQVAVDAKSVATANGLAVVLPERKPKLPKLRAAQSSAPAVGGATRRRKLATAQGGDSRPVRIINAQPGSAQWFVRRP